MANPTEQMSASGIVSCLSATLTALAAADLSLATRTPDAFVAATGGERLKTLPRPAGGTTHVIAVGALRWAMRCDANGIMDSAQVGLYFEDSGRILGVRRTEGSRCMQDQISRLQEGN